MFGFERLVPSLLLVGKVRKDGISIRLIATTVVVSAVIYLSRAIRMLGSHQQFELLDLNQNHSERSV